MSDNFGVRLKILDKGMGKRSMTSLLLGLFYYITCAFIAFIALI